MSGEEKIGRGGDEWRGEEWAGKGMSGEEKSGWGKGMSGEKKDRLVTEWEKTG